MDSLMEVAKLRAAGLLWELVKRQFDRSTEVAPCYDPLPDLGVAAHRADVYNNVIRTRVEA